MTAIAPPIPAALPTAPNRSMPAATFPVVADAWVGAQPLFRTDMMALAENAYDNAVSSGDDADAAEAAAAAAAASAFAAAGSATAALSITGYTATSATSLTIGTGAKAVTLAQIGKSFADGDVVTLQSRSDPTALMSGVVSAANMGAGTMTVTVGAGAFAGTGTFTDWFVVLAAVAPPIPASASDIRTGTSTSKSVTPGVEYAALAEVALAYSGSNIVTTGDAAPDMAKFINASMTLTKNSVLPNPTNMKVGQTGRIKFVEDGTGGWTLSYGSYWKAENAVPTAIATAAGAVNYGDFDVVSATEIRLVITRAWG